MLNRMNSHYSGTGIVSARRNRYGKLWYGTNHLESVHKSRAIIIAGQRVPLSPRRVRFDGELVPLPADPVLRRHYKAELTCGNWRQALRAALEHMNRKNGAMD